MASNGTYPGSALLKEWREGMGLSQVAAAEKLGINPYYVTRYEGGRRPDLDIALKIERGTDGAVPVSSWSSERAAAANG